ncbi:phage holin family protein [Neisseria weaveri]|uniref:phage holin family protein n=1 Tax=Neisseria weaveri TaxID=28091 RepID=UPI000D32172D|nr:phage holin family protein [Neisseria weaveri]
MSLDRKISHLKAIANHGLDLIALRLQILGLDLTGQMGSLIRLLAVIALSSVLGLTAMISLLFGLNQVLSEEAKLWVFFSVPAVCILVLLLAWIYAWRSWGNARNQLLETLDDLKQDIVSLRSTDSQQRKLNRPEEM